MVKEQVKYVWTSKLNDTTGVEIPPEEAELLTTKGIQFLAVGKAELFAEIAIPQYPRGEFKIAYEDIEGLSDYKVFYRLGTAPGSSGSPLLTRDCVALAIHNTGAVGAAEYQPNEIRSAISLDAVINVYLTEQSEFEQKLVSSFESVLTRLFRSRVVYMSILYSLLYIYPYYIFLLSLRTLILYNFNFYCIIISEKNALILKKFLNKCKKKIKNSRIMFNKCIRKIQSSRAI